MADFYTATTGNDSNPGTISSPFLTIQKGVDTMAIGDTLFVRGGTYVEVVTVTALGTAVDPIIIQAFAGEFPIIDGEAGVASVNGGIPTGAVINTDPVSGKNHVFEGLVDLKGSYITFDGFEIKRSMGRGLRIFGSNADNVTVKNTEINFARTSGMLVFTDATNVILDNLTIRRNGDYATYSRASTPPWPMACQIRGTTVTLKNSKVYENWGEGIGLGRLSVGLTIEDNTSYDNFAVQIYGDHTKTAVIQRNLVYFSNSSEFHRGGIPSEGIAINNESDLGTDLSDDIKILNNFVAGCKYNIALWSQGDVYGTSNMLVGHNTCIEGVDGGMRVSDANTTNHSNVRFKNNVVYQTAGVSIAIASPPGLSFLSNLWFSQVVDADAQDAGDVLTDPLLDLTGTFDPGTLTDQHFKIKTGSPAIGAATEDADSPAADYYGTIRADDDMGGHEFVSGITKFGEATLSGVGALTAAAVAAEPTPFDRIDLVLTLTEKDSRTLTIK